MATWGHGRGRDATSHTATLRCAVTGADLPTASEGVVGAQEFLCVDYAWICDGDSGGGTTYYGPGTAWADGVGIAADARVLDNPPFTISAQAGRVRANGWLAGRVTWQVLHPAAWIWRDPLRWQTVGVSGADAKLADMLRDGAWAVAVDYAFDALGMTSAGNSIPSRSVPWAALRAAALDATTAGVPA